MPDVLTLLWSYSNELTPHQARMNDVIRHAAVTDDQWNFDILPIQCILDEDKPTPRSVFSPELNGKERFLRSLPHLFRTADEYDIIHLTYLDIHVLPYLFYARETPMVVGPNVGKFRKPEYFDAEFRDWVFQLDGKSEHKARAGNALMRGYLTVARRRPGENAYLGFSTSDVRSALVNRGVPAAATGRLPFGAPTDVFYTQKGETEITKRLLFIAPQSAHRLKGFPLLADAMEDLLKEHPGLSVTVAGMDRFPSEEQIPDTVKQQFEFLGWVERKELADLYRRADVYIHPSFTEAGSTTYAEALACGTPVVATDICSFAEGKRGENTLLFRRGDSEALRDSIMQFYERPEQYIESAREQAPNYDISVTYNELVSEYRSLLA